VIWALCLNEHHAIKTYLVKRREEKREEKRKEKRREEKRKEKRKEKRRENSWVKKMCMGEKLKQ